MIIHIAKQSSLFFFGLFCGLPDTHPMTTRRSSLPDKNIASQVDLFFPNKCPDKIPLVHDIHNIKPTAMYYIVLVSLVVDIVQIQ